MRSKLESYFGFARKSGNLAAGYDTCIQLMKKGRVRLLILAEDASDKTREKFLKLAERHKVQAYVYGTADELFLMTGMRNRYIYAITDNNFAKAIAKEIETMRK